MIKKYIVSLFFHLGRGKKNTFKFTKKCPDIKDAIFIRRVNSEKYFINH